MAKAHLRNAETEQWQVRVGGAIERVQQQSGLTLKEFAGRVQREERQVARWFKGQENPQLAAIFAVAALRPVLILALAELAGADVEVETTVRIVRRKAIA